MKQIEILNQMLNENYCAFEERVNETIKELDKVAEIIDIRILNNNKNFNTDVTLIIIYDK